MDKKKKAASKKPDKKPKPLRDLPRRGVLREEARNVKGGDDPPSMPDPAKLPPPP